MKAFLSIFLWLLCLKLCAQERGSLFSLQNPDTVKQELVALFQELSIKHPGFYRYNDTSSFDLYIDSVINSINEPLNELEILRKTKPIIAKIGCLHTSISLSEESERVLNEEANCLPFFLTKIEARYYVWKSFGTNNTLMLGDEVLRINNLSVGEIYQKLLSAIPMDGYNQSGKYQLLHYNFPLWYRNMLEISDRFEVETADGTIHKLNAVKANEFPDYKDIMTESMSLIVREEIAILRIPSFADSYLQEHQQNFKKEIKQYMQRLQEQKVKKLLIDLRGNTGGTDSHAAFLSSYFFDKAYRYWKYIEVTEALAEELKGGKRLFYGKPTYEEGKWLWSDKGLYGKEFSFTRIQEGSEQAFEGSVYMLTDGLCMSSCADFVAIMQFNHKAQIIGEETGGGYTGNTSGLIPSQELDNGLTIDIPLLKYYNYVDFQQEIGRGSLPDISLHPSLEEIWNSEDFLERILSIITTRE